MFVPVTVRGISITSSNAKWLFLLKYLVVFNVLQQFVVTIFLPNTILFNFVFVLLICVFTIVAEERDGRTVARGRDGGRG